TVNSEYQAKITELNQLSIDEEHLFSNTGVGVIFVDKNLRIRKFTPAAAELFNLLAQDLGRPFEHLTHEFVDVDFQELITASLTEQRKVEHELRTKGSSPYIAQILPYHNSQGAEDGVVLSFVGISAIKEAEQLYQNIVQASPVGIVGLGTERQIVSTNESLLQLLGYDEPALIGHPLDLLLTDAENHPLTEIIPQLSDVDTDSGVFKHIACEIRHRNGRHIHVEISIRQIPTPDGLVTHLYMMDMSERQEYLTALETHRDTLEKEVLSRTAELAKRNEEYEDLYENAPDMHASIDATSAQIIQCNQRMVAMTGYPKVELIGKEVFELYSEESRDEARAAFSEFVRSGTVRSRELIISTKSGDRIPVLLNVEAVRNEEGDIVRSRSTWTDVSDVYYLQKENTTFLLATQGSEIGIWDWDLQTGDQIWSAKFYELLGYFDATAPVLDFNSDITHPSEKLKLDRCFESHINGDEASIDISVRLRTNTSGYRWFRLQGKAARDSKGKAIRIVGSARDVHDAVTAQIELKRQADILTFITEETNDGWWDWSVQTDYEYMSDRFWRTFGVDPETMPSNPSAWQNLIHPEDLERTLDNFNKHVATKGEYPYFQEVRYRHVAGHWVTVICRGQVIEWDDEDQPVRMIGVHTDVTRLKEQEAKLETINEELSLSNEELERFAYITSHDLKAPLRGISNLVEFLKEDMEPLLSADEAAANKVADHMNRLTRQTQRMQGLIRGVLEYSRLDGIEPKSVSVDVAEMLGDIAADHQLVVDSDLLLPDDLPTILTDRVKLEQVFGNLISNAAKFHPDREALKIIIRCQRDGAWLNFSVADNGNGIDERYHERIFDMFQTLHTRDKFESTGVGLTMVKRIVGQFGGTVSVESVVGEGAKFSFTWPVTTETLQ
ncbi:MAG: PAS domain S-box protein, partial [Pseudomonadota bacterium]